MLEALLKDGARELGIDLDLSQVEKFTIYLNELLDWNKKFNLTSITKDDEIVVMHFLDSLCAIKAFPLGARSVVDIGAGAGFPGVPIKIARPDIRLTAIDSVKKKADFLEHLVIRLSLSDVKILWGRAEDLAGNLRGSFDLAVLRAVAPLNVLAEYSLPFLKIGGAMLALKGEVIEEEVKGADNALKLLGGKVKDVLKIKLPGTDITRSIVVVEKTEKTPEKYPRRAGLPKKKPL